MVKQQRSNAAELQIGDNVEFVASKVFPDRYPITADAMEEAAKVYFDEKNNNSHNYSNSVKQFGVLLESFIKEFQSVQESIGRYFWYCVKNDEGISKKKTQFVNCYLIYQLRHIFSHSSGVVIEDRISGYNRMIEYAIEKEISFHEIFPTTLEHGKQIVVSKEDADIMFEIIRTFMYNRVNNEDKKKFEIRRKFVNLKLGAKKMIQIGDVLVEFDSEEGKKIGIKSYYDKDKKLFLNEFKNIDFVPSRAVFENVVTGESIPVLVTYLPDLKRKSTPRRK